MRDPHRVADAEVAANRGFPERVSRQLAQLETRVVAVLSYALLMTDETPPFGPAAHQRRPPAMP